MVLRNSDRVEGAFERIGILDPEPNENNNPHRSAVNDGKHPLTDNAARFFKEAEKVVIKIV